MITFPWTEDKITDGDLPNVPCILLHAKMSQENESVSVFIKTKTLKSASWITNWFTMSFVVVKKTNWNAYEAFKEIPFTSEVIRDQLPDLDGNAERDDMLDIAKEDGLECTRECPTRTREESSSDDDFIKDYRRIRKIRRTINRLDDELGQLVARSRPTLIDLIDISG